jgi:hypothetical protein
VRQEDYWAVPTSGQVKVQLPLLTYSKLDRLYTGRDKRSGRGRVEGRSGRLLCESGRVQLGESNWEVAKFPGGTTRHYPLAMIIVYCPHNGHVNICWSSRYKQSLLHYTSCHLGQSQCACYNINLSKSLDSRQSSIQKVHLCKWLNSHHKRIQRLSRR